MWSVALLMQAYTEAFARMAAVLLAFMRDGASTIFSDHLQSIRLIKDIRFHSIPPNFWAANRCVVGWRHF